MNEKSCKWFVTDTLFKQSFIQMMTWINMLMTDLMMNQHELRWKEKEVHWINLIYSYKWDFRANEISAHAN